eukprot:SAG31_NODE_170_length_21415_cov_8.230813_8_plen_176_part_00
MIFFWLCPLFVLAWRFNAAFGSVLVTAVTVASTWYIGWANNEWDCRTCQNSQQCDAHGQHCVPVPSPPHPMIEHGENRSTFIYPFCVVNIVLLQDRGEKIPPQAMIANKACTLSHGQEYRRTLLVLAWPSCALLCARDAEISDRKRAKLTTGVCPLYPILESGLCYLSWLGLVVS